MRRTLGTPRRTLGVRLSLAAVLVLSALGTGAGLTSSASAASATPQDDAREPAAALVTALQRDLGLTETEARERLSQEAVASELEPAAKRAAGPSYAGSWFDPQTGKLIVAVTTEQRADAVRRTGAEPRQVTHSAQQLDAVKAQLDQRADTRGAPSEVSGWRVDVQSNQVTVDLVRGAERTPEVREFLAAAERLGPVTVEHTAYEAPSTLAAGVVGGDPYYTGNVRCSIGFSVHGGFVTAGHCGQAGAGVSGWDRSQMGTFQGSSFPTNDYAFVSTGHGWWTEPVVLGWGTVSDVLVRGSAEAPIGASICRSGSTTHWHCGTVEGKNETVNYSEGAVHEMTRTSVCAEPGDSGGSYVSGDQAQGVTSGGSGNCTDGGRTFFQPLNEILSVYGLTLHTA